MLIDLTSFLLFFAEFEDAFNEWDVDGTGLVEPANVDGYSVSDLAPYDLDNDGKYTKKELKQLFFPPSGFNLDKDMHTGGLKDLP
jgi:hypothetical protein